MFHVVGAFIGFMAILIIVETVAPGTVTQFLPK